MSALLPIVYVRGFAGGTAGIDSAVDDPFYGFNNGATHVRVGGDGQPAFYQFEGPLVRLMSDDGYQIMVYGNQLAYLTAVPADITLSSASLWIYRFYDAAADAFGASGHPYRLLDAAEGLLEFVQLVRAKTSAPKVWLVAHSMGGLICRSMLQKVCPDRGLRAAELVDKLVTIGSPHNGIAFSIAGVDIGVPEIAPFGAEIFNREVMYQYLVPDAVLRDQPDVPKDGWDAHVVPADMFPSDRIFCVIGTNAADYGLVSKVVGPKSDGLVQIDNAYVRDAHRAYIHRSHSGVYGEVNSEESYQNLRRFLLGARKVRIEICGIDLPAPPDGQDDQTRDVWQAELLLSIRGLPVLINEQRAAHYCPVLLNTPAGPAIDTSDTPVPLITVFLLDSNHDAGHRSQQGLVVSPRCRYSLQLRALHLQERHGTFFWQNHLETAADWEDTLIVDIGPADATSTHLDDHVWAAWKSQVPGVTAAADPITSTWLTRVTARSGDPAGSIAFSVDLPPAGRAVLGANASIRMTATPWA